MLSKLAHVSGGVIADLPVAVPGFKLEDCFAAAYLASCVEVNDNAQVGWTWDGTVATAPVETDLKDAIPVSVSSAQAKIQCLRTPGGETGKTLLDDITAAVQAAGGETAIWFAEARTWERANPYVANLSAGLKLTSAQVDQLFVAAAQIAA